MHPHPYAAQALLRELQIELPAGFDLEHDLSIDAPVPSLRDYFKPWSALGKLPQGYACLAQMFRLALGALAIDGVVYAELRHSPFKVVRINEVSFEVALQWAIEALEDAHTVLPGLGSRLILGIDRAQVDLAHIREVLYAFKTLGYPQQIVGLKERDICLELCLRSNVLTSAVSSLENHPIFPFIACDIPFALCTDSPGIHAFSLSQEYVQFYELTGRADLLESMFARQTTYAFASHTACETRESN